MFALVYTIDGRTERHLLTTGDTTVGRSPGCDLVISDPSISRRHARFRVHGEHCLLSDLRGRNGTFLNGELIAEAEVKTGDTVTLGRFAIVLQLAAQVGLTLSEHEPVESPSTLARHVDEPSSDSRVWRLTADADRLFGLLATIARRVVHWHSARELLDQIVDVVFDTVPVERVFLLLPEGQGAIVVPQVARTRSGRTADGSSVSRAIVERVMAERLAILSMDAFPSATPTGTPGSGTRWFIAAPLWNYRESLGVLYADSPETQPLSAADLDLLHALALYAASAIEQARDTDRLMLDARRPREASTPGAEPSDGSSTNRAS